MVREEINGSYGLQVAVADRLIRGGYWTKMTANQQSAAEAGAARAYSIHIWQTLTPTIWQAVRFSRGSDSRAYYCNLHKFCLYEVDGETWSLSRGTSDNGYNAGVTESLRTQLFGATSPECLETWQFSSCGLGVRMIDVFKGRNGWGPSPPTTATPSEPTNGDSSATR